MRDFGINNSFSFLRMLIPNTSVISISFLSTPIRSSQSKWFTMFANISSTLAIPRFIPGHIFVLLHGGAAERLHLLNAEHVCGDELPRLPPVLAVRREGDVRRAVHDDVGDEGWGPRCQDVVVRAKHLLGGARRRHYEGPHGAQAEDHHVRAVLPGQAPKGDMWEGANKVQVPDDG